MRILSLMRGIATTIWTTSVVLVAAACGGSEVASPHGEAGADGSATPDSAGTEDSADSANVAPEAAACGASTTGACNTLANTGTAITPTCVAGAPPKMAGGPIADGTYVLVSGTAYTSSCTGVSLPGGGPTTLLVSAGCIQSVDVIHGDSDDAVAARAVVAAAAARVGVPEAVRGRGADRYVRRPSVISFSPPPGACRAQCEPPFPPSAMQAVILPSMASYTIGFSRTTQAPAAWRWPRAA